jgi:alpha-L-rhamnosidase
MDFAKASYNSIHGQIEVEWKRIDDNNYEYTGVIPANCEAKVILPSKTETVKSGTFKYLVNTSNNPIKQNNN